MKDNFKPGDIKEYRYQVKDEDVAAFHGRVVHHVCSTYTLAREMEWAGRLFVLEMKEDNEEGVGTSVNIQHHSPAFPGEELLFTATVEAIRGRELLCSVRVATKDGRLVATGETGQRVLTREKLNQIFRK